MVSRAPLWLSTGLFTRPFAIYDINFTRYFLNLTPTSRNPGYAIDKPSRYTFHNECDPSMTVGLNCTAAKMWE